MSGELSILTVDIRKSVLNCNDLFDSICCAAEDIRLHHEEIEVSVSKDTHQIAVKFYSYRNRIHPESYLDNLCTSLRPIISSISVSDEVKCILNIKGSIESWQSVYEFILANIGSDVDFRIINENTNGYVYNKIGVMSAFVLSKLKPILNGSS